MWILHQKLKKTANKLNFIPPELKDGIKVSKLNPKEVFTQTEKWKKALIGYVIGGAPPFKEMLRFVYGVWNFVSTPQIYLHDEGYYIFRFDSDEDKARVMQQEPFTFNNRPLILKH